MGELVDEFVEGIRLPLTSGGDGNFLVTVGFGTPKRDFTLLFDTGSGTTWTQCEPCSAGCNQQIPIFDPSTSSSFSNATCDPTCDYPIKYHDGTYSSGYYVKDTLTIASDLHPNFVFGCAQKIDGNFGGAAGILGVRPGKYSLMAQTNSDYSSLFCYCLPAAEKSAGYVVLGLKAFATCLPDKDKMIPISLGSNQDADSYFVTLTGITIGQQRLDISGNVSSPLKAIIDSGTSISRLPFSLYSDLRQAFQGLMSQYTTAPPSAKFDTCYNLEGQNNWTPPKMVLYFEGVDLDLIPSAVTFREKDNLLRCARLL
ncbi:aspartyl protease AED1-like [Hevea brasiliensis]|uniref:aspartyl protease AED1-like n=1 Tax=Hevea brasiliensis TaxID=3981 RepID=UPI0025DDB6A4|nr:aspartyl protease AED1-like [Hevea brasiliensis]